MSVAPSTPYDSHRRRLRFMEAMEGLRLQLPPSAARQRLARALRLTPEQLANIRKGKLKDLYGETRARIDEAFIASTVRQIATFEHELALARAASCSLDAQHLATALASKHALEELIAEAGSIGLAVPPRSSEVP